jgi:hypothetical protein
MADHIHAVWTKPPRIARDHLGRPMEILRAGDEGFTTFAGMVPPTTYADVVKARYRHWPRGAPSEQDTVLR